MDDIFPAEHRQIFPFYDGARPTRGDPLAIERRYQLAMIGVDQRAMVEGLTSKDGMRYVQSLPLFLAGLRAGFAVVPFDPDTGAGMTDAALQILWRRFSDWRNDLKSQYRAWSEHLATFGRFPTPVGPPPADELAAGQDRYRRFCGEYWNRERCQALRAVATYQALQAHACRRPSDVMVDAAVEFAESLPFAIFEVEAQAMDQANREAMARKFAGDPRY